MSILTIANRQIVDEIGASARLEFRDGAGDTALLVETDGDVEVICTIALQTLQVLADGRQVAGAVLALCNAQQRILRRRRRSAERSADPSITTTEVPQNVPS